MTYFWLVAGSQHFLDINYKLFTIFQNIQPHICRPEEYFLFKIGFLVGVVDLQKLGKKLERNTKEKLRHLWPRKIFCLIFQDFSNFSRSTTPTKNSWYHPWSTVPDLMLRNNQWCKIENWKQSTVQNWMVRNDQRCNIEKNDQQCLYHWCFLAFNLLLIAPQFPILHH